MTKKKVRIAIEQTKQQVVGLLNDASDLHAKVEQVNKGHIQNSKEYEAESKLQLQKLQAIEDKFTKRLEMEVLERKERENAMIQSFEQKAMHLKQASLLLRKQIQKQRKIRESLFEQVTSTLQDDLPTIMAELNEAKAEFESEQSTAMTNCEGLIEESQKYVSEFEKEQKANSEKLFELVKDLTRKIKTEIEQEKAECQSTHEQVFAYVEQACNKLTDG